jgi:hypothetical protein
MQLISPPLRASDLVNSHAALGQRLEEFSFRDQISLSNILPCPWGFALRPSLTPRFRQWWAGQDLSPHLWLDSTELDSFGSLCLLSRDPAIPYAAICSWREVEAAADYLRLACIGPSLWERYHTDLLGRVIGELVEKFALQKRPLNSAELPNYSDTKWGVLVQLYPEQSDQLINYLCLELPLERSLPILKKLGGNISSVVAFSPESVRIGLCFNGYEDAAIVELQDWLRSKETIGA